MEKIKAIFLKYFQLLKEQSQELRKDRNALIFLVFLFLSTCFWILNALSKDNYSTELKYPIKFSNDHPNELIKGNRRRDLTLRVKGGGFSILNYQINENFLAYTIDLSHLDRVKFKESEGVIISTKDYLNDIEGKLATGISLVEILPDTLFIPMVEKVSKKVAVQLNAEIKFDQQCQLSGDIILIPDSIQVSGPKNILDTLAALKTKSLVFENLKDTLVRNIGIEEVDWLELAEKRVIVKIPVEPFTETSLQVPIQAKNLPDSLILKAFPSQVKVSYRLGLSSDLYNSNDFKFIVDFERVDFANMPSRFKVKMADAPLGIGEVDYSPLFVEYLLEKKNHR